MMRAWSTSAKLVLGVFAAAVSAFPQAYTISAKPGVVNYIEGSAYVNGRPVSASQKATPTYLNANDILSTDLGKAEVLLSPGVFLRVGNNTQVRMVSPSLVDTQIELKSGEAIIEVDDLVKDNRVSVIDHAGTVSFQKPGLYKLTADAEPAVSVMGGKADVSLGGQNTELSKGHEVSLAAGLKTQKFDTKQQDDLYAWSNIRSEYDAASSYQVAKNVNVNSFGGGWGDYGYAGTYSPGWAWNGGLNSWAWLPGNGAFFSPFGYGFYSPGLIGYAPVYYGSVYPGGGGVARTTTAVPVNPKNPPAVSHAVASPAMAQMARAQSARTFATSGFTTASGAHVSANQAAASVGGARASSSGAASSGASSGGFSGGRSGGGFSAASSGGAHSGGGGGGGVGGGHH